MPDIIVFLKMKERSPALQRALQSPDGRNGSLEYCSFFSINHKDLFGTILDIGSGDNWFDGSLSILNKNVFVVNLNPQLIVDEYRASHSSPRHQNQVSGLAQGLLPFKDESFDFVLAHHSVPKFLHPDDVEAMFEDVWRVLKKGGIAYFYPFEHAARSPLQIKNVHNSMKVEAISEHLLMLYPGLEQDDRVKYRIVMRKEI